MNYRELQADIKRIRLELDELGIPHPFVALNQKTDVLASHHSDLLLLLNAATTVEERDPFLHHLAMCLAFFYIFITSPGMKLLVASALTAMGIIVSLSLATLRHSIFPPLNT